MQSKLKRWNSLGLAVGLCVVAISAGLSTARAEDSLEASAAATDARASTAAVELVAPEPVASEAGASTATATPLKEVEVRPASKPAAPDPSRPYFIEFRARAAYNYGHAFVVHGRVDEPITKKSVVGLHPAGESPVPWMIGHIVPVPSETGWSDGDVGYNDKYITAKYRVYLTEAEYRVLLAKLRQMQANSPIWSATAYNCVAFVGDIAAFLGMQHPFHWVMPKEYIQGIKQMAGGRQQLPSSWLASVNPAAARQQARQEPASTARQQTASAPAANARRQPATVRSAARSQASPPTAPSYATAQ
jgi:hypothetical protein